ncbi:YicC/YloC family endoribonuclease [Sutcliffiella cohnii]|uniref:YicC family protein n=1 Tax=Sutcliffiella cohnii TaxID=33932 RepID=A0A223KRK3_9BACI|nr:YicC/YloC family endoribonuclease [Sutcliffiella cohnii]AST92110.1 YicC family protein [Sutcliffiella cohnii]MED4015396.1 YicC family protein [Sutcliffiella cohnii]
MVKSMTGYGSAFLQTDTYTITVEMKSVNHRFCEINMRMPKQLLSLEEKMKRVINMLIHRGRVEVFITIDGIGLSSRKLEVDWDLLRDYIKKTEEIKSSSNIQGSITISDVLQLDNVLIVNEVEDYQSELETQLLQLVETATRKLIEMRTSEGETIKTDLLNQVKEVEQTSLQLMEYAPNVILTYKERLEKRMKDWVQGSVDEQRIATEVAIFADRSDINEELQRIQSHVHQFQRTLETDGPIGRKLDFIIQELNRETNTIGSKSNDAKISNTVINMKACLEKMKEQVQNIE